MSALRGDMAGGRRDVPGRIAPEGRHEGFVLPRFLRKPFRLTVRLFQGYVKPPRYVGLCGVAVLFAATGFYGMVVGGHSDNVVKVLTSTFGFAVEQVRVAGNHETSDIDVLGQLDLDGSTSLIGFNADAARKAIVALPWVENADVRKVYPGTVLVTMDERKPYAIWQNGADLSIVDENGDVIAPFRSGRYAQLPLVVGDGAEKRVKGFIADMASYPALAAKVRAYVRIADRRWDLLLDNGVRVMLPEEHPELAMAQAERLDREQNLFGGDIVSVDLRLNDRVTVQLTDSGMESRDKALKEQQKNKSRTGGRA